MLFSICFSQEVLPLTERYFHTEDMGHEYQRGTYLIVLADTSLRSILTEDETGDFIKFKQTQGYDVKIVSFDEGKVVFKPQFEKIEPFIRNYAKMVKLLGPVGYGQLTKMVNQICIAGTVQGLAEGIHFAKLVGLDVEEVISTISKGAAQSWQMENRYKTMNENFFDYGFAVDWMRKDLAIALEEGRENKAHLPVTALVDQFYSEVQALGGNRWDTSSLIARLEAMNHQKNK